MDVTRDQPELDLPTKTIGERLVYLRTRAGWSNAAEFCRVTGIDRQTLWRIETGRAQPGEHSRKAIMRALRKRLPCQESWLIYGDGLPPDGSGKNAVEAYLKSQLAVGISKAVRDDLRKVNWEALGVRHWSMKAIHRVREAIEMNHALP